MPTPLPALIFDLDGTLTDSKPGIVGCLRKVIEAYKISDSGSLDRFVGPPVEEWTVELMPHATHEARVALARDYRACYDREGWKNNSVFPLNWPISFEPSTATKPNSPTTAKQACSPTCCATPASSRVRSG